MHGKSGGRMRYTRILAVVVMLSSILVGGNVNSASREVSSYPYLNAGIAGVGCSSIDEFTNGKIHIDDFNSHKTYDIGTNSFSKLDLGSRRIYQVEENWYVTELSLGADAHKYTIYPNGLEFISSNSDLLFLNENGENIQYDKNTGSIYRLTPAGTILWSFEIKIETLLRIHIFRLTDDLFCVTSYKQTQIYDIEDAKLVASLDFMIYRDDNLLCYSKDIAILFGSIYSLPDFKLITTIDGGNLYEISDDSFSVVFKTDNAIELKYFDFEGKEVEKLSYEIDKESRISPVARIGEHLCLCHEVDGYFEIINIREGQSEFVMPYESIDKNQFRSATVDSCFILYHGRIAYIFNTNSKKVTEIEIPTSMQMIDDMTYWYFGADSICVGKLDNGFSRDIPIPDIKNCSRGYIDIQRQDNDIIVFPKSSDEKFCPIIYKDKTTIKIPRPVDGLIIHNENGFTFFRKDYEDGSGDLLLYRLDGETWSEIGVWENVQRTGITYNETQHIFIIRLGDTVEFYNTINQEFMSSLKIDFEPFESEIWSVDDLLYSQKRIFDRDGNVLYRADKLGLLGKNDDKVYFQDKENVVVFSGNKLTEEIDFGNDDVGAMFGDSIYIPPFLYDTSGNIIQKITYGNDVYAHSSTNKVSQMEDGKIALVPCNYHSNFPVSIYKSCPTFSLKKVMSKSTDEITFEIESTRTSGDIDLFHGVTYLVPWKSSDETTPVFAPIKEKHVIGRIYDGMRDFITFNVDNSFEEVALLIESNGLLDVEKSVLENNDGNRISIYDGVATSFERQEALVLSLWSLNDQ